MPASLWWRHAAEGLLCRCHLPLAAALVAFGTIGPGRHVAAQGVDIEAAMNGVVQIVATRSGETLRGTGFIVAYDRARSIATVLTSSHVISGARFTVRFHADSVAAPVPVPATDVVAIEAENRDGLAVFLVRGNVPSAATVLEIAGSNDPGPRIGRDDLQLLGYPAMSTTLNVSKRPLSGRAGALYLVDPGVSEGSSGGPVLLNGKVVGLVANTTTERASAIPFATIRAFLEGSGVTLVASRAVASPPSPPVSMSSAPTGGRGVGEGSPGSSGSPSTGTPGAARRPAATISLSGAEFFFPGDTGGIWRWYQPNSPLDDTEYAWKVDIASQNGDFSFELYIYKGKSARPAEGDLKALLREASVMLFRGDAQYDKMVLTLLPDVSADGLTLRLVGPGLPAVLQSLMADRPMDAYFKIVKPGAADQEMSGPITYAAPAAAAAPPAAPKAITRELAFTVVNQLGVGIENLWVAPMDVADSHFPPDASGIRPWPARTSAVGQDLTARLGPDRLGEWTFGPNDEKSISFETTSTSCDWALAARPTEERFADLVWIVDLCAGSHVTLVMQDGQPTAIVK